jgi:hypothetical protein
MEITIDLTESEWCEVVNAVGMRADDVLKDEHDMTEDQVLAWHQELKSAQDKIASKLDEKGVTY